MDFTFRIIQHTTVIYRIVVITIAFNGKKNKGYNNKKGRI